MWDSSKVIQTGTSVSKRRKKMDSAGLCFFCLQTREIKSENGQKATISAPVLLRCLIHHLQINPSCEYGEESESPTTPTSSTDETNEDIEVDLCHSCEKVVNRFSDLALQLEGIYMEMEHYLEGIHTCISESAKNIDLIKNVSQFPFVDKLRKDIADKSLKVRSNIIRKLKVPLSRTSLVGIEKAVTDTVEDTPTEIAVKIENEKSDDDDHSDFEDSEEGSFFNQVFDTSSQSDPSSPQLKMNLQLKTEEEDAGNAPQVKKKRKRKPKPKKTPKKNIKMNHTLYCKRNSITKKFQCNLCETQFKAPQYGRIHHEVAHLKKRYPCDICNDAEFSRSHQLKDHQQTCAERLANPTIWKYYRNKAYTVNREGETKTYHCTKCEKISTNVGSILTHFKTVHNPKNIPCDICKVALFTCNSKLKQHQKRCGKPIEKPDKKDFLCDLCGKGFYFKRGLREHHGNAHMERKNVCEVCGKKFISRNDLRRHKKGVHKL